MVSVRSATVDDVDALLELRAVMFGTTDPDDRADHGWQRACRQILLDGLSSRDLIGVVAETDEGDVVASGVARARSSLTRLLQCAPAGARHRVVR